MKILGDDKLAPAKASSWPTVGGAAFYLPSIDHATNANQAGQFPWVLGVKTHTGEVKELAGKALADHLRWLKRQGRNPIAENKRLVPVRPGAPWPAKVTAVNDDGTVNLDIQSNNGGVTLHYDGVPVDPTKQEPHSCHQA